MGNALMTRAAAKVADTGIGIVNSHIGRGVASGTPISAAARAALIPIGEIPDSVNTAMAIDTQPTESPRFGEIDGWEFAVNEEEIMSPTNDLHLSPVFLAPPSIEESKTATGELKDALEKVFVSSPKSNGSIQDSSHSLHLSRIEECENKDCLARIPSTPKHAIQAFRFLDSSPEVQGIVASVASDPNVWEAVLQNPALRGYILSQNAILPSVHENIGGYQESTRIHEETMKSDNMKTEFKNKYQNIWKNIEQGVIDMMTSLSDFLNSLFGVEGDKEGGKGSDITIPGGFGKPLGPTVMGVIVLVIMVVVLKRV